MKAPEKIYLQKNTTTDCYEEFYPEWFEARARKTDIEYIRSDVFIKKTCEWLRDKTLSELCLDFGNTQLVREFVDNYKDYIKGE